MPASSAGFFARVGGQFRQFLCGLHGHDALLHFENGRMSLLCTSCGYESPGWQMRGRERSATATTAAAQPSRPTARILRLPVGRTRHAA